MIKNNFYNKYFYFVLAALIVAVFLVGLKFGYSGESETSQEANRILLTPENLPAYMEKSSIINDLPKDARVEVHFGENVYSVENGEIILNEISSADIIAYLPENYLNKEWYGLCSLLKTANKNGHLVVEKNLADAKLAWKYRGMLKYKECI